MGQTNPQDELVEEVISLRAQVAQYEEVINTQLNQIEELGVEVEQITSESESYQDEVGYHENEAYAAEQRLDDLKLAVQDELTLLVDVPLRDLVQSINDLIYGVRDETIF